MLKLLFAFAAVTSVLPAAAAPFQALADSQVFNRDGYVIVKKTSMSGDWTYVLADTKGGSSIEVYQQGANIKKFTATVKGTVYSILNGNGNWKMMPWPNRTKGGKFVDAAGATRDMMIKDGQGNLLTTRESNGNAIHGMVRDRQWEIDGLGADEEGVYLRCYFDTQGFASLEDLFGVFRDHTVYHLKGGRLIIDAFTENKGDKAFPNCGWGFHPWVNAPLQPQGSPQKGAKAKCSLLLPAHTVATVDAAKIPTGSQPVATYAGGSFDFTKLRSVGRTDVDHFFTDLTEEQKSGFTRTVLIDYGNAVRVQYLGQFPFYPWMVIFIPGQDVVCIEHQTEEVNGLNTKQHLIDIPARSQSPVGRIMVEVDGDTTLAFTPPTAARPQALLTAKRGDVRLLWNGAASITAVKAERGRIETEAYDMRGRFLEPASEVSRIPLR